MNLIGYDVTTDHIPIKLCRSDDWICGKTLWHTGL